MRKSKHVPIMLTRQRDQVGSFVRIPRVQATPTPALNIERGQIERRSLLQRPTATLAAGMSNSISSSTTRRLRVQSNDRRPRTPRGGLREGGWLRVKNRSPPRAAESPKSKGGELPPWFLLCGGHLVTPGCRACEVGPWRASLGAWKRHPTKPRRIELVQTVNR